MRILKSFIIAAVLIAIPAAARAQAEAGPAHPFGLGLMIGNPTGLSGKWYLNKPFALQAGLGYVDDDFDDGGDDDGFHLHVDVVWHPRVLARTPDFTLPFYFGVGGRILDDDDRYVCGPGGERCTDNDTYLGVRVPVGLLMDFNKVPLDIFLELALVVDFVEFDDDDFDDDNHDRAHMNLALGARYYF
jgi:hypothetical protein